MSSNLHELELPLLTPGQAGDESGPPRTGTASAGPPVLLFPSLAGSVLECQESPRLANDTGPAGGPGRVF